MVVLRGIGGVSAVLACGGDEHVGRAELRPQREELRVCGTASHDPHDCKHDPGKRPSPLCWRDRRFAADPVVRANGFRLLVSAGSSHERAPNGVRSGLATETSLIVAERYVRPSAGPVAGGLSARSAARPWPWPADAHEDQRLRAWARS